MNPVLVVVFIIGTISILTVPINPIVKKFIPSHNWFTMLISFLSLLLMLYMLNGFTGKGDVSPANTHMNILFLSYPHKVEILAGQKETGIDAIEIHYSPDESCAAWNMNGTITVALAKNGEMKKYEFGQFVITTRASALIFPDTPVYCVTP